MLNGNVGSGLKAGESLSGGSGVSVVARCAAIFAILSSPTPLPHLLANGRADARADAVVAGALVEASINESRFNSSEVGADGSWPQAPMVDGEHRITPASLGTLDELIEMWPVIGDADGVIVFVDFSTPIGDGFLTDIWSLHDGAAQSVGHATYTPLHHGEVIFASDLPVEPPNGSEGTVHGALAMYSAIGLLTAHDGPMAESTIGVEGVIIDWAQTIFPTLEPEPDDGERPIDLPEQWGPGPFVFDPTILPTPLMPAQTMPSVQAEEGAAVQYELDEHAAGQEGGNPIQCTHPGWLGYNGVECCYHHLSATAAKVECRAQFWGLLLACLGLETAGAATLGVERLLKAIARCLALPSPGNLVCVGALLAVAAGAVATCYVIAKLVESGCVQEKLRLNEQFLVLIGCDPNPPSN